MVKQLKLSTHRSAKGMVIVACEQAAKAGSMVGDISCVLHVCTLTPRYNVIALFGAVRGPDHLVCFLNRIIHAAGSLSRASDSELRSGKFVGNR